MSQGPEMNQRLKFSHCTDTGQVRPDNQDAYCVETLAPPVALLAVADGMGGHSGGAVASRMALDTLAAAVRAGFAQWPDGATRLDGLRQAAISAHDALRAEQAQRPELAGMGTTLTAVLVWGTSISLVHAGDSRCYRVHGDEAEPLTDDHSVVGELVKNGTMTETEAMVHPQRHLLTSALGSQDSLRVDLIEAEWQDGDVLLLCSDGLSSLVTAAEVAAAAATDRDDLAQRLVALANGRGGPDNITVLAAWREG